MTAVLWPARASPMVAAKMPLPLPLCPAGTLQSEDSGLDESSILVPPEARYNVIIDLN